MKYLEEIGKNAKKAFEDLKSIKHNKIVRVLDNYIKLFQKIKKGSSKKIKKMLKILNVNISLTG